jgi:hypothetical protein
MEITIPMVQNPNENASPGNFALAHVDKDDVYISYDNAFGSMKITAAAKNIDIRSLKRSSSTDANKSKLFATSVDYTFKFYMAGATFNSNTVLIAQFPGEYQLGINQPSAASYTCSTTYLDDGDSVTAANKVEKSWNTNATCSRSGCRITMSALSSTSTQSFTSDHIITWSLSGLANPEFAKRKVLENETASATNAVSANGYFDRDTADSKPFTIFTYWSDKYQLMQHDTTAKAILYRSYGVLNSAYYGFDYEVERFGVSVMDGNTERTFDPLSRDSSTDGRIMVTAGSQTTDLKIKVLGTNAQMGEKSVVFTPSVNSSTTISTGGLSFTSKWNEFKMWQSNVYIYFRVAAAYDTPKGLYYIDWSHAEDRNSTNKSKAFHQPVKTLVEVTPSSAITEATKYQFMVASGTDADTPVGSTSIPFKISIANAPAKDVSITLAMKTSNTGITIQPATITFKPDKNEDYFQVTVPSNYDVNTPQ